MKLTDTMSKEWLELAKKNELDDEKFMSWAQSIPDKTTYPVWRYELEQTSNGNYILTKTKREVIWSKKTKHFVFLDARNNRMDPWNIGVYSPFHRSVHLDEDNDRMAFIIMGRHILAREQDALETFGIYERQFEALKVLAEEKK